MSGESYEDDTWTIERLADDGIKLRIVNMLGHGSLRSPIDIKQLALLVRNADYTPRGFNALILRFQIPRASVLAYRSGKFLVVGTKCPEDAHLAVEKFRSILQKVEFPSDLSSFVVANIVGSTDVRFKIRLEGLAREHRRFCTYEPELFPGLIYRMLQPRCTLLIFVSGKVVITGYKTPSEGHEVLCKIFPVLLQFRVRSDSSDDDDVSDDDYEME